MSIPRVTVGVPVYNGEATLAETLDSLLAQDFTDFSVVISDNASTDNTRQIAEQYVERDARVSYTRNETNLGAAFNYNRLVELAPSEYFKWAAANDLVAPSLIGRCVEELDRDPDLVLAYGKTTLIDESGSPIRDHEDGLDLDQPEAWERMRQFADKRWQCNPIYGVIRTDALRRTPLFQTYHSADVTLLGQLAYEGRFRELPEQLFFRRVLSTSPGMGAWTPRQFAAWLDPRSRRPRLPRNLRVFIGTTTWILRHDGPPSVRVRTAGAYSHAWLKRQVGITIWRTKRRIRSRYGSIAATTRRPST